jgi:hypothetical protein
VDVIAPFLSYLEGTGGDKMDELILKLLQHLVIDTISFLYVGYVLRNEKTTLMFGRIGGWLSRILKK